MIRLFIFIIIFTVTGCCHAQVSTYASFFGDDALIAANLDFRDERPGVLHYSIRMGVGFWSEFGGGNTLTIPHHVTLLIGKTHALESGFSGAFRPDLKPHYRIHSVIGYRYQKRPSGLMVRAYIDPLNHKNFHYKFGAAVGYSF